MASMVPRQPLTASWRKRTGKAVISWEWSSTATYASTSRLALTQALTKHVIKRKAST
jgi:hypothetical protein